MSTTSVPGTTSTILEQEFEQLNALVAGYDDSPFDRRMRHWMLRSLSPWIRGASGLELGCLYGEFTKLLVSHFQRLTVVDAAQQFLDITAKTVGQPVGCSLSYKHSLFETLACDEQFDCIFLMHVLEHLIDPVAVLEKAKSFLAPAGRMFLVVPNATAISRQLAARMGALKHQEDFSAADIRGGHRRIYRMDTLQGDARSAGLTIEHSGGIFFKPLANFQFDALAGGPYISEQYMEACYELGKDHPTLCASIFLVCQVAS
jgi:2-polyprenyl-3-methyl-5-hydroxy-6-metoxy-1,4-benzoquinol methylase